MSVSLLDVNVLLALAWPNHQHHGRAHEWFRQEAAQGWATCAVTELGFVRLSSNPSYSKTSILPSEAAELLAQLVSRGAHHRWSCPAADAPALFANALGHQQVTDAFLVAVAAHHKGRVVTFDAPMAAHDPKCATVIVLAP